MIVLALALSPLLLAVLLAIVYLAVHDTLRRVLRALNPAWLWFTGLPIGDGVSRTNATWTMRSRGPRPVLHNSGHAIWFHHLPRLHRAGIRTGATLALVGVLAGLALNAQVTLIVVAVLSVAGLGLAGWRLYRWVRGWQHRRHYVKPLEGTLVRKIPIQPASIKVQRDGDVVKQVEIEWPAETELDTNDQQAVLQAVTTRLPIEAPDAAWKLRGRDRFVRFTPSEPVRTFVPWDGDFAAAVQRAALNELVFGIGKRDAIVAAKYSQSPHLMIPGDSGGGKSNLAAVLLLQEMMRGSLIFNLDPKWISHLWLQDLPNVINAHSSEQLHLALEWIGVELDRRTQTAWRSAAGTGRVRGKVGCRVIVLCEELNYGMPGLKEYWLTLRAGDKSLPKRSPAIAGLVALACAGRASDMHAWLVAQLMTVESTGVKDSTIRTNAGLKAMIARLNKSGWDMAVGKNVPMPPTSTVPGRIHLVTGDGVRETQVPYLHLEDDDPAAAAEVEEAVRWARQLAVSGDVAQIPIGGDYGLPRKLVPACVLGETLDERSSLPAGQGAETIETVPESGQVETAEAVVALKLSTMLEQGLIPGMDADPEGRNLASLRKWSQRWDDWPKRRGVEGPAHTYYHDEVAECVQSHRQGLRVVS